MREESDIESFMYEKVKLCQMQQYRKKGWHMCELRQHTSVKKPHIYFVSELCNGVDCNQFENHSIFSSSSVFCCIELRVFTGISALDEAG